MTKKFVKEGWSNVVGPYTTKHYFVRKERFWNHNAGYLPDPKNSGHGRREGFFFRFKSLCGTSDFLIPIRENPELRIKIEARENPCLRCLLRLAKMRGIV